MSLRLLAAAAGLLLLAACQTTGTGGDRFSKSDVLEGFGKAAYGWEFLTEPRNYIIRHGQPLRFLMAHETGDEEAIAAFKRVLGFIRSLHHAPEIAAVDYVDINSDTDLDFDSYNVIVLALGPANYEQIYEPMVKKYVARGRTDMADLFYFNRCFARVRENGGTIDKSLVLMDVDQVRNREA